MGRYLYLIINMILHRREQAAFVTQTLEQLEQECSDGCFTVGTCYCYNRYPGRLTVREQHIHHRLGSISWQTLRWINMHPETRGRIDKLNRQIKSEKLNGTAMVQARYASAITFDVKPLAEITAVAAGTRGVAGGGEEKKEAKAEEKPKKGFGLGSLSLSKGKQAESTQASASAGNRAVGRDRAAPGGPNPAKVTLPPLTPAEIDAFKKGIAG